MLALFLNDAQFHTSFDMGFSYRDNIRYREGLSKRVKISPAYSPIRIFDHYNLYNYIDKTFSPPLQKPMKILINLLLIKYLFLIMNTVILYRHFSQCDIDLIHINNGGYPGAYSTISAVFAARLAGINRVIYVINNIPAGYHSPERWLDYPIDRVLISLVTQFVTGSDFTRKKAIQILKIPSDKIIFIHNGIVPRPVTETRSQVLSRLELPDKSFIISVIANLEERKGHIYLFKALQYLKETHPEIVLPLCLIEGTGPLETQLKKYVQDMNISSHVVFLAHEEHIYNLLNASDCIILPSIKDEDLPNVILEAMQLGKPIIASSLAGIPEEIETNSGILFPPGDSRELAEGIMRMISDESLRITLGKNAKNRFNEKFTHEKALKNYFTLYLDLLEDHGS